MRGDVRRLHASPLPPVPLGTTRGTSWRRRGSGRKEQRAPPQVRVWLLLACPTRRLSSSKSSPTGWRARCLSTPTSPSTGCSCSAYSTSRGGLPASTPEHHLRQSGLTPPVPFLDLVRPDGEPGTPEKQAPVAGASTQAWLVRVLLRGHTG